MIRLLALVVLLTVSAHAERPVIYQLFIRHFSNLNETREPNGPLPKNGSGKFAEINDTALKSLHELGITHVWLTGALQQATRTDYTAIGQPADDPDICKGQAGSPYAIKDYFDVCPDYALDPTKRMEEFQALIDRCHAHGLKVLLDFVPNHVSRSYTSDVRADLSFGAQDDHTKFFTSDNSFFYLRLGAPPLHLPTKGPPGCDGIFEGERDLGRVTGNNAATWTPSKDDWFETVKLNYGWNYLEGRPKPGSFTKTPRTWELMDAVLAHWQERGVDGFRCDMAHMIPMQFWRFAIERARGRKPGAFFLAEAYDNDRSKTTDGNVLDALLEAGFDSVYDDPSYDLVKSIYDGPKWANDLDALIDNGTRFHRSMRYAENHDEVRLANPKQWRGAGLNVGRPVSALLFALGRGPVMIYNGQEVGEPALAAEGYGGDDGKTTIFDYWSLPELVKWANAHRYDGAGLNDEQRALRKFYAALLRAIREPVFAHGTVSSLTRLNSGNPRFGRLGGEKSSGHWLAAFLRTSREDKAAALVAVNLHPSETMTDVMIELPPNVPQRIGATSLAAEEIPLGFPSSTFTINDDKAGPFTMPPLSARLIRLTPKP